MLNNYVWEIFGLATAGGKPVDIGVDLLVHNLEHPEGPQYPGGEGLDYPALAAEWKGLTPEEQAAARNAADGVIRASYEALCEAWEAGDREAFEAVLAEAAEAPEA